MAKPKRIFIAATRQNDGKTTVSLGLMQAFKERFPRMSFIKPIGQRYIMEEGHKVDEDSVLIDESCDIGCELSDMSPIAVERGFTEKYIESSHHHKLKSQILESFRKVSQDRELVIIEGTGHAGVGSCFDLSNAQVAKLLKSKVILVSSGGVGRPIDEIMLNMALFEKERVDVAGVIINKVHPEKYDKVKRLVTKGLKRKKVKVLGVVPYRSFLSAPSLYQIMEETNAELICGRENLKNRVLRTIVGAMEVQEALQYLEDKALVITPGDREDIILAVLNFQKSGAETNCQVSGIVLSGGIMPDKKIIDMVSEAGIPMLFMKGDTYKVAAEVHGLTVKIRPEDTDKIDLARSLVKDHVDIDGIIKEL